MTLDGQHISVAYSGKKIIHDLSLRIAPNKITSIIGGNGCGKSTLLKAFSRIHPKIEGAVLLEGADIYRLPTREVAKKLAILPQTPEIASSLSVYDLVALGRYPHQQGFKKLTAEDQEIIHWAMDVTSITDFALSEVDSLSGGQRQRAWLAMALAQKTEYLLLDEPTTYLDIAHQLEILHLVQRLNREYGTTILMILHDINHVIRFSDEIIAMKDGQIVTSGVPAEVITPATLATLFQVEATIVFDDHFQLPQILRYDLLKNKKGNEETL